jgi:hypothetical protein
MLNIRLNFDITIPSIEAQERGKEREMADKKTAVIKVKDIPVTIGSINLKDYISLTDVAKFKDAENPRYIIQNWMRTKNTVEFLGIWELLNNDGFNRVEFEAVRNEAGFNSFVLTPQKWIDLTNAIGIISKSGRHGGGTFAHKEIAFEFSDGISNAILLKSIISSILTQLKKT